MDTARTCAVRISAKPYDTAKDRRPESVREIQARKLCMIEQRTTNFSGCGPRRRHHA
jgi:hypothetical protein